MTAAEVFRRVRSGIKISVELTDGTAVLGGETILKIQGSARSILTAERVALKFLATPFRHRDADPRVRGGDWKKSRQNHGHTERQRRLARSGAGRRCRCGGTNHRFGLFDAIL